MPLLHDGQDQRRRALAQEVLETRRSVETAGVLYSEGRASFLEVLDAQRGLFTAELTLAAVQRLYLGSTVQLYKALGGGWAE